MDEDKLGIELISKDTTINTLLPIMSELYIDVDAQEKIVLAIMNQKIAYDVEKVVAELEEESFPTHENYSAIWLDKALEIVKRGGVE